MARKIRGGSLPLCTFGSCWRLPGNTKMGTNRRKDPSRPLHVLVQNNKLRPYPNASSKTKMPDCATYFRLRTRWISLLTSAYFVYSCIFPGTLYYQGNWLIPRPFAALGANPSPVRLRCTAGKSRGRDARRPGRGRIWRVFSRAPGILPLLRP